MIDKISFFCYEWHAFMKLSHSGCIRRTDEKEPSLRREFIFIMRKPDGTEYEQRVTASSEADAERRLKNVMDVLNSPDRVVSMVEVVKKNAR